MIVALCVSTGGPYFGLEGVECYDLNRNALSYFGPFRVIAHPPCERWGRYWSGGPNPKAKRRILGDDGGLFKHCLEQVRTLGGVLEHPEGSHAWRAFGLKIPPRIGGWVPADDMGGFTCCVAQGHYGHKAQKYTWLYAKGIPLPELLWGPCLNRSRIDEGFNSKEQASAARASEDFIPLERLSKKERIETPLQFRDLLIRMVTNVPKADSNKDAPAA